MLQQNDNEINRRHIYSDVLTVCCDGTADNKHNSLFIFSGLYWDPVHVTRHKKNIIMLPITCIPNTTSYL